jgi:hypothetical protein
VNTCMLLHLRIERVCRSNESTILYMGRKQGGTSTDWLMALPQSTLVDVMQRRCDLMCSVIRWGPSAQRDTWTLLTDEEFLQQEARMSDAV